MGVLSIPLIGLSVGRWETARKSDEDFGSEYAVDEAQEELINSVVDVGVDFAHFIEASDGVVLRRVAEIYGQAMAVGPDSLLVLFLACKLQDHVLAHINLCSKDLLSNLEHLKLVRKQFSTRNFLALDKGSLARLCQ